MHLTNDAHMPPPRLGLGNGLTVDAAILGVAFLLLGLAFAALAVQSLRSAARWRRWKKERRVALFS